MEMRSLSLRLDAPGSCAAQVIESGRHTANTCVMSAIPATRNVRSVRRSAGKSRKADVVGSNRKQRAESGQGPNRQKGPVST